MKNLEKLKQNPIVKKLGLNRILLACILVLMFVVFKVVLGSKFPVGDSIKSTLNYVYFLGFLSLGVTFVIATGGIDFSIGPVMFCCALISGYCMTSYHVPCAAAMVICILIGFAFGVFNGWMVSYMSVPPFIISMASMNIAKGIASVFTKTQSVSWPLGSDPVNGWFRNLISYKGFPVGLVIFLAVAVICGIILYNTKPGRYILCLGSNSEAVRLSGVNTKKWRMLAHSTSVSSSIVRIAHSTMEDDTEVECAILTIFPVDAKEYIALLPLDENGQNQNGEVYLYTFARTESGDPMHSNIESDEEYAKAAVAFDTVLQNAKDSLEKID